MFPGMRQGQSTGKIQDKKLKMDKSLDLDQLDSGDEEEQNMDGVGGKIAESRLE